MSRNPALDPSRDRSAPRTCRTASGFQFRLGHKIQNSLLFEGYLVMGALRSTGTGWPDGQGPAMSVTGSTILNFGVGGATSHPGWGLTMTLGAQDVLIDGLLISGAHTPLTRTLAFEAVSLGTSGALFVHPVRGTRITNSVLDAGGGLVAQSQDGSDIPVWSNSVAYTSGLHSPTALYKVGQLARSAVFPGGITYIAVADVPLDSNIPLTNTAYWAPTTWEASAVVRTTAFPTRAGYICIQNAPAGTALTNTAYWLPTDPAQSPMYGYPDQGPGLVDNGVAARSKIISALAQVARQAYIQQWGGQATADTWIDAAAPVYASRAAYAAATPGAVDTERTIKTYLQSVMGWTVASSDGIKELIDYITGRTTGTLMHHGNWDARLDPAAMNAYIRAGWGMS